MLIIGLFLEHGWLGFVVARNLTEPSVDGVSILSRIGGSGGLVLLDTLAGFVGGLMEVFDLLGLDQMLMMRWFGLLLCKDLTDNELVWRLERCFNRRMVTLSRDFGQVMAFVFVRDLTGC
ncbi:unnamed protein product [Cochlearia groenlandica]